MKMRAHWMVLALTFAAQGSVGQAQVGTEFGLCLEAKSTQMSAKKPKVLTLSATEDGGIQVEGSNLVYKLPSDMKAPPLATDVGKIADLVGNEVQNACTVSLDSSGGQRLQFARALGMSGRPIQMQGGDKVIFSANFYEAGLKNQVVYTCTLDKARMPEAFRCGSEQKPLPMGALTDVQTKPLQAQPLKSGASRVGGGPSAHDAQ
jgi:hypothetical protein